MYTESFDSRSKLRYIVALSKSPKKESLTSQAYTLRFLQQYSSKNGSNYASFTCGKMANVALSSKNKVNSHKGEINDIDCWYSKKEGDYTGTARANSTMVVREENSMDSTKQWSMYFPRGKPSRTRLCLLRKPSMQTLSWVPPWERPIQYCSWTKVQGLARLEWLVTR